MVLVWALSSSWKRAEEPSEMLFSELHLDGNSILAVNYLLFSLWADPSDVLSYHESDIELLQELRRLGRHVGQCQGQFYLLSTFFKKKKYRSRFKSCEDLHKAKDLKRSNLQTNQLADLLHDGWSREPMVFLQHSFGEVFSQSREVVLPHVGQVLAVVHTGRLISGNESFDEPGQEAHRQTVTVLTLFLDQGLEMYYAKIYFCVQKPCKYEVSNKRN